jgi:hypothetical protein
MERLCLEAFDKSLTTEERTKLDSLEVFDERSEFG